jgi:hypothetical protein
MILQQALASHPIVGITNAFKTAAMQPFGGRNDVVAKACASARQSSSARATSVADMMPPIW